MTTLLRRGADVEAANLKSALHNRMCPAFNQGDIGDCTGNAITGNLMTVPLWKAKRVYSEVTAIALYSQATKLDPSAGVYPPDDPGSDGLDVCKAALKDHYITQYRHATGLNQVLAILQQYPVMIGANWYDSMDEPDSNGVLTISPNAQVRGGHEWSMVGLQVQDKQVKAWNSWDTTWGPLKGAFILSFETLDRLLNEQGDAIVPIV